MASYDFGMPIGISEDHAELHRAVRGWMERHCPPTVPRSMLDAPVDTLPPFWPDLAAQGWLGIHVAEEHAGEGASLLELVVVLEELGRAGAPGPYLGHVLAETKESIGYTLEGKVYKEFFRSSGQISSQLLDATFKY